MDLINRQDAIEVADAIWEATGDKNVAKVWQQIKDLPSAQPERKKGKWIDAWRSAFDGTRHWHRECSECGYERDDDNIDKDTNFCPNCGADMRGDKDV